MADQERTDILVAVNKSSEKGYPNPSKRSKVAFEWILENIVRTNVDRFGLFILHVHQPYPPDAEYEEALEMLDYFDNKCLQIGVAHLSWTAPGDDPKVVICEEAQRIGADLLVLGIRKRASIRRFFNRGESAAEYCIKHTDCPVITANKKATQRHIAL
ncbi:universal stress protein A-like protein [Mangifera indica]|uniref:universal stress protein A-like protein n=1 Tax=Mangifera indica TaxID=29780 RepID=UPI001CFC2FD3|nr:universal stress protein A-like protein [Mangifera indica]